MRLSDVQLDSIARANKRINIWHGPVRGGKTIASIVRWLRYIDQAPKGGELYMIGRTFGALRRNVIGPMEELVGKDYTFANNVGHLWGRVIHVVGMNDVRAELLIRGSTSAGTYGDEVTTWPEDGFRMAMTRLSISGSKFFGTTNPDNPRHYLKKEYLDRRDELNLADFTWPITANPFLPQEYLDDVMAEYTGLFYKRFILGQWVAAEGAIYGMLDENVHVFSGTTPVPDAYILGIDYGTSVPMVFLMIGIKYEHNGRPLAWVEREHYYDPAEAMRNKTDGEHAGDLMRFLTWREHEVPVVAIYCDPSAASFRAECAKVGIGGMADIDGADNAVVAGISTVSTMLAQGRLRLHERCEQTLTEAGGYVWDPKAQLRGEDAPRKTADHAMDALRYAIHTHFGDIAGVNVWIAGVRGA